MLLFGDNRVVRSHDALVVFVWLLDFPKDKLPSVALLSALLTVARLLLHYPNQLHPLV
jgi:hypothetical protein